jgi:hypothetical protein
MNINLTGIILNRRNSKMIMLLNKFYNKYRSLSCKEICGYRLADNCKNVDNIGLGKKYAFNLFSFYLAKPIN